MPVTPEQWKRLYATFDPSHRLEPSDAELFVERPGSVAATIAERLSYEPRGKWVVCGSMGSGKSSELVHLGGLLHASHAVIGLDLPNTVASIDDLQPAEVLFLIGAAAVRAAGELWGHTISQNARQDLGEALRPLLGASSFELQPSEIIQGAALFAAHVLAPGAAAVTGAATGGARAVAGALQGRLPLRHPSPLAGLTRPVRDGEPDLVRLQTAVNQILDEVATYRPPLVLVDGLDKLYKIDRIRGLFANSRALALPDAPVVYTGPITLMLATEWQAAANHFHRERLTNIVSQSPATAAIQVAAAKIEAGQAALREVVERRLRRLGLGVADVFTGDSLDRLLRTSGGLLRGLILYVREAIFTAARAGAPAIDAELAEAAITEQRKEFEITMNAQRREELVHVLEHGEPRGASPVSHELLLAGYILPYSNSKVWFEPHPILRDDLVRRS